MRLNSKQIVEYTGGDMIVDPIDARRLACGLTWDSRTVKPGDLYVALPGERTNGHAYVEQALVAGAAVILVQERLTESQLICAREMGAAVIEVSNTSAAITDLARAWRGFLHGQIIGVTGSTGKTTVKNLIRDMLSSVYSVVATEGNQNNELGVPKTLLAADQETQFVVVEMGMRGAGQIEELCDFVKPTMGVISNIGECHIELLGTREAIAAAKAELIESLPVQVGHAFLNACDEYTPFIQAKAIAERPVNVHLYNGSGDSLELGSSCDCGAVAEVFASDVHLDEEGRPHFILHARGEKEPCSLTLQGLHNVHNACAATAVGLVAGMSLPAIAQALASSQPEVGRQHLCRARAGFSIIDDAYNANPDSMRAAISMFSALAVEGRRVAVLGDMTELGDYAQACHEGIGRVVAQSSIDALVCVGELSAHIARAARDAGMNPQVIWETKSIPEALGELDNLLEPGDVVLVKASHSMELDRIVRGLAN